MTEVDGDFLVEVAATLSGPPQDPPVPSSPVAFHGAGLMIWSEGVEAIRFERAAFVRYGQLRNYLLFENHLPGRPPMEVDGNCPEGPVFLRLVRVGSQVTASFSSNGMNWQHLASFSYGSRKARVGVAAVNTSSKPMKASFEHYKLLGP